jgi:DNA-binding NarL/FixJ family response regulator
VKRAKVLLADDHAVVIEGLRRILDSPEFEVVNAVADGRALVQAAVETQADIIITDVVMPLLNGIEAARQIYERNPNAKIIFLTMHTEPIYAVEALAAGGRGYVLKSSAGDELVTAIRRVLEGHVYVAKAIAQSVKEASEARPKSGERTTDWLTSRQREVLQLLAEGRQVKEIAAVLNVSPRTVEFHKYRIMDTLGVRTVAELARYAVKRGFVA